MKSIALKISALLLLSAVMLTALCCCDIVRLKYPGEKEGKAVFREQTVDFAIYTDPNSPRYSRGVICEGGEMLDFTIKWDDKSYFYAYTDDGSDTLFEGKYYASGKLYGTGTFELEILKWNTEKRFDKTELVFKLHVE